MGTRQTTFAPEEFSGTPWVRIEMKTVLTPGGSGKAYALIERDETIMDKMGWSSPGNRQGRVLQTGKTIGPGQTNYEIDVFDRWDETDLNGIDWGANYLLPGERAWAQWDTTTQQYEIVGTQGLLRRAVANEAIGADGSGEVAIQDNDGDSGETVTAHATWGGGAVSVDAKIWVRYDQHQAKWIVFAGSSGGGTFLRIWFKVETEYAATRSALCTVLGVPNGMTLGDIPGQVLPQIVEVCDPAGCYFNEPNDSLINRHGYAWFMTPLQATLCQPDGYDLEGQWTVDSLCCATMGCD